MQAMHAWILYGALAPKLFYILKGLAIYVYVVAR